MKPTKEYNGRSRIRMYNCDCMDFMEDCDMSELAIVDPPYGLGKKITSGGTWASKYTNKDSDWDVVPDKYYFKSLFDTSENQIIWGGNYFDLPVNRHFIIWHKPQMDGMQTMSNVEYAWSSFDKNAQLFKANNTGYSRIHPTQKPVKLYKWLLTNYAKEGDTILDTHGGSMSIAIACWDLGFDLDICELDTDYFNDAVKRFEQHISQTQLF